MAFKGRFVSAPIPIRLGPRGLDFDRADILIHGVDQSGPSFEGRVFLNNPDAALDTPVTPDEGYAGSFHVYGYGIWPGDLDANAPDQSSAGETIRAPIEKDVIATEAVRQAASQGSEIIVTLVPVFPGDPATDAADAMKLESVSIEIHPV